MLNITLKTLLKYSKQEHLVINLQDIAKILEPIYAFYPTPYQVVEIVTKAYLDVLKDARYELPVSDYNAIKNLILSPVFGTNKLASWGNSTIYEPFTVIEFYIAIISHMIGNLRITRVDWCKDELLAA